MALIKIYALFTIRKQRWLTRQVAVEDGQVVQTAEPAEETTSERPVREPMPAGAGQ